jgi:hypothetical protein
MRQASTRCIAVGCEGAGAADGRAEQGALFVTGDGGGTNVLIEEGYEIVMRRHLMPLAAFLVEADPPALAVGEVVLDPHMGNNTPRGAGGRQRPRSPDPAVNRRDRAVDSRAGGCRVFPDLGSGGCGQRGDFWATGATCHRHS